jgi:hypothetical protein
MVAVTFRLRYEKEGTKAQRYRGITGKGYRKLKARGLTSTKGTPVLRDSGTKVPKYYINRNYGQSR